MLQEGCYTHRYYTVHGALYEQNEKTVCRILAENFPENTCTLLVKSSTLHENFGSAQTWREEPVQVLCCDVQGRYEYLRPRRTSLKYRVPEADEGCIDFMGCLLSVDPKKRPSAQEALQHPWLQHNYESVEPLSIPTLL